MAKYLKYTKKLANHILSQMEQGLNLIEICRQYNKKLKKGSPTLNQTLYMLGNVIIPNSKRHTTQLTIPVSNT